MEFGLYAISRCHWCIQFDHEQETMVHVQVDELAERTVRIVHAVSLRMKKSTPFLIPSYGRPM